VLGRTRAEDSARTWPCRAPGVDLQVFALAHPLCYRECVNTSPRGRIRGNEASYSEAETSPEHPRKRRNVDIVPEHAPPATNSYVSSGGGERRGEGRYRHLRLTHPSVSHSALARTLTVGDLSRALSYNQTLRQAQRSRSHTTVGDLPRALSRSGKQRSRSHARDRACYSVLRIGRSLALDAARVLTRPTDACAVFTISLPLISRYLPAFELSSALSFPLLAKRANNTRRDFYLLLRARCFLQHADRQGGS